MDSLCQWSVWVGALKWQNMSTLLLKIKFKFAIKTPSGMTERSTSKKLCKEQSGQVWCVLAQWINWESWDTLPLVRHKKFDRIGGTSSSTFFNFKYGGPREICVICYLLPLDGAAYLKYWPLWGSYFSDEVSGKSTLF